jgi:hypothetical protein
MTICATVMRYVIVIVSCTVFALWDAMSHEGAYTRGVLREIERIASLIF